MCTVTWSLACLIVCWQVELQQLKKSKKSHHYTILGEMCKATLENALSRFTVSSHNHFTLVLDTFLLVSLVLLLLLLLDFWTLCLVIEPPAGRNIINARTKFLCGSTCCSVNFCSLAHFPSWLRWNTHSLMTQWNCGEPVYEKSEYLCCVERHSLSSSCTLKNVFIWTGP